MELGTGLPPVLRQVPYLRTTPRRAAPSGSAWHQPGRSGNAPGFASPSAQCGSGSRSLYLYRPPAESVPGRPEAGWSPPTGCASRTQSLDTSGPRARLRNRPRPQLPWPRSMPDHGSKRPSRFLGTAASPPNNSSSCSSLIRHSCLAIFCPSFGTSHSPAHMISDDLRHIPPPKDVNWPTVLGICDYPPKCNVQNRTWPKRRTRASPRPHPSRRFLLGFRKQPYRLKGASSQLEPPRSGSSLCPIAVPRYK